MNSAKFSVGKCAGLLITIALFLPFSFGQGSSSGLTGTVKDAKGNRIRGAEVTVTNSKIGVKQKRTTKDDGVFTVLGLRPSQYTVVVEKSGFKRFQKDIPLSAMILMQDASPINLSSNIANNGQAAAIDLSIILIPETEPESGGPRDTTIRDIGSFAVMVPQSSPSRVRGSFALMVPQSSTPQPQSSPVVLPQLQGSTLVPDAGRLQLQSLSGERSDLVTNNQIVNLGLNGRDLLDFMKLLPGVTSGFDGRISTPDGLSSFNINGTRNTQHEFVIDGSSNVDTTTNTSRHVTINLDAIAEIKVLTGNYQAEYGKAAGGFIQVVTKSGTNEFRGGGRYFYRNESLNANNFFNNAQNRPRPLARYNNIGYEVGGPIYLPGALGRWNREKDRGFFYWNQEFYRQLIPPTAPQLQNALIRVPTAAERNGDFSASILNSGAKVFIRNPDPRIPSSARCEATPKAPAVGVNYQEACFRDPSRATPDNPLGLNIIPRDRWFSEGQKILSLYPLPNLTGDNVFNYSSQRSSDSPRREDILRLDLKLTEKTNLAVRAINNSDRQELPYGRFPATLNFPLTPIAFARPGVNASVSLTHSFSDTLINEVIFGPSGNRITIAPKGDTATNKFNNLNFPLLFPQANRGDLIPNFAFGGVSGPTTTFTGVPFVSANRTWNLSDNVSKIYRNHTFKIGIFVQRALANQTLAGIPFAGNGTINFNGEADNFPGNTGYAFANALIGNYASYQQGRNAPTGFYRYTNIEGYVQDLWRVTPRLALELGLRVSWYQPQYDEELKESVFTPRRFDGSQTVRLYRPTCLSFNSAGNCTDRRAVDPVDPTNIKLSSFIGQIVPGSGNLTNGFGLTDRDYPRGGFDGRGAQFAPRFGFAYDLLGDGRTILRGGFGIFYDRIAGDRIRDILTNPPNAFAPTIFSGDLRDIPSLRSSFDNQTNRNALISPPDVFGFARDGKIPNVYSFSFNVQRDIGWETVLDVAYAGTLGRHLTQARNLNSIPYGTSFTKAAQDPTLFPGGIVPDADLSIAKVYKDAGLKFDGTKILPLNLLRPYPGYGTIRYREFGGSSNYHSLQVSLRRRFSQNLMLGVAYTFSRALATASSDGNSGNDLTHPDNTRAYSYRLADYDRRHIFVANYVYALPKVSRYLGGNWLLRLLLDDWQISGITTFTTGRPIELGSNITGIGSGTRLTGSPTDGPGFYLIGDPRVHTNGLQLVPNVNVSYGVRINPNAFRLPKIGELDPWPRNYLTAPGINNHDVSIFKNVPLDEHGRSFQFRVEMFNAFNHTQFSDIQRVFNIDVNTGQAIFPLRGKAYDSSNYRSSGCSEQAALGSCFGEFNVARDPRTIQLGFKLYF